jgi:divalent metal cation (Fe/Co/Zn/Cd) transporter
MRLTQKHTCTQGKKRLEPVGVLVFATCMALASLQIVVESIRRIVDGATGKPHPVTLGVAVNVCTLNVCIRHPRHHSHTHTPHTPPPPTHHPYVHTQFVVIYTIAGKLLMGLVCHAVAKRTGSSAVRAYGIDHWNDVASNLLGIAGMVLAAEVKTLWWMVRVWVYEGPFV